jgi:hypothetical protein
MSRKCSTCQHTKRAEIDRRLAAGEPNSQIAEDYDINPSSLHRHRTNCLRLASSNTIMKVAARGSAALSQQSLAHDQPNPRARRSPPLPNRCASAARRIWPLWLRSPAWFAGQGLLMRII